MALWLSFSAAGFTQSALTIETLEGEGAVYNLRARSISPPRVRIVDAQGRPAAGAFVTFRLPDSGPGALFPDGRFATVTADDKGEAAVPAMKLNSLLGQWQLRVSVAHQGMAGRAAIQQINAAPVDAMAMGGKRSRSLYWLAAVGAGAAALAAVGLVGTSGTARSGGVSAPASSPAPPAALTISAGSGSIGAP